MCAQTDAFKVQQSKCIVYLRWRKLNEFILFSTMRIEIVNVRKVTPLGGKTIKERKAETERQSQSHKSVGTVRKNRVGAFENV